MTEVLIIRCEKGVRRKFYQRYQEEEQRQEQRQLLHRQHKSYQSSIPCHRANEVEGNDEDVLIVFTRSFYRYKRKLIFLLCLFLSFSKTGFCLSFSIRSSLRRFDSVYRFYAADGNRNRYHYHGYFRRFQPHFSVADGSENNENRSTPSAPSTPKGTQQRQRKAQQQQQQPLPTPSSKKKSNNNSNNASSPRARAGATAPAARGSKNLGSKSRSLALLALSEPTKKARQASGQEIPVANAQLPDHGGDDTATKNVKKIKKEVRIKKGRTQVPPGVMAVSITNKQKTKKKKADTSPSLLPPIGGGQSETKVKKGQGSASVSDGLSAWGGFLEEGSSATKKQPSKQGMKKSIKGESSGKQKRPSPSVVKGGGKLPPIANLFPPDLTSTLADGPTFVGSVNKPGGQATSNFSPPPAMEGVLPVSDLFYRSSQAMDGVGGSDDDDDGTDDEDELPFSKEQSNGLTNDGKPSNLKRKPSKRGDQNNKGPSSSRSPNRTKKVKRRNVGGSIQMLVDGVPINTDPPRRALDLFYDLSGGKNWHETITTTSSDFGPALSATSADLLSAREQELFCEHFVHSAIKWDICPEDLRSIVDDFKPTTTGQNWAGINDAVNSVLSVTESATAAAKDSAADSDRPKKATDRFSWQVENIFPKPRAQSNKDKGAHDATGKGSPSSAATSTSSKKKSLLEGELVFTIDVSKDELESGDVPNEPSVLEDVLRRGVSSIVDNSHVNVRFTRLFLTEVDDETTKVSSGFTLALVDDSSKDDDDDDDASIQQQQQPRSGDMDVEMEVRAINAALARAVDDGSMQLAVATAAKEETRWSDDLRERIVDDLLFEDDDENDGPLDEKTDGEYDEQDLNLKGQIDSEDDPTAEKEAKSGQHNEVEDQHDDGPFGIPGLSDYHIDDIFLGGGNDGVFWNYAEDNVLQAPYQGQLGLRLVDATVQRAKERQPRVIAIGDVHGCIDELQALLRKCDYRPGDLVVFLGDLVSKGPDSISVVQMAREIGALGVRGNHDFEVIRWYQAIKSGLTGPHGRSEHSRIALRLTKADMKWMYSLPWYMASHDLGALFVHAGFVSGIRLSRQNPRLMMNMRSILPDGTVTSKYFNNWPWARLWDGPKTVLFGHDALRGLQQYEHAIGLDTGCVYGGRLTACILPEKRLVSVASKKEYVKYRRKQHK